MSDGKKLSELAKSGDVPSRVMALISSDSAVWLNPPSVLQAAMRTLPCADIDSLFTPGIYSLQDNSTGTFPGGFTRCRWAIVEVIVRGSDIYQRMTDIDFIAIRRGSVQKKTWNTWRETALTPSSTE